MPLKKDVHVKALHTKISSSLVTFQKTIQQLSSLPTVRDAVSSVSAKATEKRTLMQIAMDDLSDVFEDTVAEVVKNALKNAPEDADDEASYEELTGIEIPYEIYRGLLEKREVLPVTLREAKDQLNEIIAQRIDHPSLVKSAEPLFITLTKEAIPLQQAAGIANIWADLVHGFGQIFSDEETIVAENVAQGINSAFSKEFSEWVQETQEGEFAESGAEDLANNLAHMGVEPGLAKALGLFGEDIAESIYHDQEFNGVEGRDEEIRKTLIALVTNKSPQALLIGKDGVGKSEITKAVAAMIEQGDVPEELEGAAIIRLKLRDLKTLSGQGQKADPLTGQPAHVEQFSERLQSILEGVALHNKTHQQQIILSIDEFEGMMGGVLPPLGRAKDILASVIANTQHLRVIGEVSEKDAKGLKKSAAHLYRKFRDIEVAPLAKKHVLSKLEALGKADPSIKVDSALLEKIYEVTRKYRTDLSQPAASVDTLRSSLAAAKIDGAAALTIDHITGEISDDTGLPKDILLSSMQDQISVLREELPKAVVGQPDLEKIIDKLETSGSGLRSRSSKIAKSKKPLASFLMVGNTGVGKTYTGKILADILKIPFHRIDMTNFMREHSVASLIGSPPGYIGFDGESKLQTTVGKTPFCVLMLDEIEKAHDDIFKALLPALEEGEMQLADGVTTIDFSNCIILMSSNLGTKEAASENKKGNTGFSHLVSADNATRVSEDVMMAEVERRLAPEFRNRVDDILMYKDLTRDTIRIIAMKGINEVSEMLREQNENLSLELTDAAIEELLDEGFDPALGARPMAKAVEKMIEMPLSRWFDKAGSNIKTPSKVVVSGIKDEFNSKVVKLAANQNKLQNSQRNKKNGTNGPTP